MSRAVTVPWEFNIAIITAMGVDINHLFLLGLFGWLKLWITRLDDFAHRVRGGDDHRTHEGHEEGGYFALSTGHYLASLSRRAFTSSIFVWVA